MNSRKSGKGKVQAMYSLRPYLEFRADVVESILAAHRVPGRVTGGTAGPRLIRFFVQPAPHVRFAGIQHLADDLALGLQVPQVRVSRGIEGVILEFANPNPRPVTLRDLLQSLPPLPLATALLGLSEHNAPLLARLPAPDVAHILIAGTTGCGKSVLLRTIAASLLLSNAPNVVGLVLIDPKGRTFPPGLTAAHLLRPVITAPAEALEALRSLVHLLMVRDRKGETLPHIVVCIDELADLIMSGDGVSAQLERLVQRGREAGLHLVAATQRPSAAILSGIVRANFPLRLVGKVVSAEDAHIAAGRGGTGAERLQGKGDFLAVNGEQLTRFQTAYSTLADLPGHVHIPPAPVLALPEAPTETDAAADDDIAALAARLEPWWAQHGGEWGGKSKALHYLFGENVSAGGWHWQMTQAAIDRLTTSSSTRSSTALNCAKRGYGA